MDYFDQLEARLVALTASGAHRRRGRPAFGVPRFGLGALAAALSVLVVLGVVGAFLTTGSHKQAPAAASSGDRGAISPTLVRNYRVLRRPVQSTDRLPAAYVRHSTSYGLLPALARRVVIPNTRLEMWLEPGQRGFCVLIAERTPSGAANTGGFGGTCQPAALQQPAVAIGGGAFLAAGPPMPAHPGEPHLASGVLPDRVTSVELVTSAGRRSSVTTADGFFAVRVNPNERLYAVTGGHRQQIIPLEARPGVTAQSIPAELASAFAVFRRRASNSDALPAVNAVQLARGPAAKAGVNPALARRVGDARTSAFVVPGNGVVCLVVGGGHTCMATGDAIAGRLLTESFGASSFAEVVTGLVPDGVSSVTFRMVGGGSKNVAVHQNIYQADLARRATTMTYTGHSGHASVAL